MIAPTTHQPAPLGRPPGVNLRTHCCRGHEFTPENTAWDRYRNRVSSRQCRICRRERNREWRAAHPYTDERRAYHREWERRHRLLDIYLPRILAPFGREVSEMSPLMDMFLRDRGQVAAIEARRAG